MPGLMGSATERRLAVTRRRRKAQERVERVARRRAGIPDPVLPYRRHKPYKTKGQDYKANYSLSIKGALALSLLLITGVTHAPIHEPTSDFEVTLSEQELIAMEEIVQTRQNQPPPPPPKPPVPVEVPDEVILENDELNLDASLDINEPLADLPPPPPVASAADIEEEEDIFVVVEEPPVMIGGISALMAEVKYPPLARKAGLEGRVTVEFVVDETGAVLDPQVLRGVGGGCDEEALRAVRLMKFEPGRQRGRAVKVRMATSVNFRLTG